MNFDQKLLKATIKEMADIYWFYIYVISLQQLLGASSVFFILWGILTQTILSDTVTHVVNAEMDFISRSWQPENLCLIHTAIHIDLVHKWYILANRNF